MDGVATNYLLDGSTIIAQKSGDDILWFLYDSDGTRVGFTYNGTAYYYATNGAARHSMNSQVKAARKSLTAVHARPSNRYKHEQGQSRKQRDLGGKKGDKRRKPNPNKRRPNKFEIQPPDFSMYHTQNASIALALSVAILADDITFIGVIDDALLIPVVIFSI